MPETSSTNTKTMQTERRSFFKRLITAAAGAFVPTAVKAQPARQTPYIRITTPNYGVVVIANNAPDRSPTAMERWWLNHSVKPVLFWKAKGNGWESANLAEFSEITEREQSFPPTDEASHREAIKRYVDSLPRLENY